MGKLNKEKRRQVKDIIDHEIDIFPCEGEIGFEEYLDEKVKFYISGMNAWGGVPRHRLLLRYPDAREAEEVFTRFFASPGIASGGGEFTGCFAIDVTDYLKKPEHPSFRRLLAYIQRQKSIHFMLLVFEESGVLPEEFQEVMSEYGVFSIVRFSYPSAKDLAEYFAEQLSKRCSTVVASETEAYAKELFSGQRLTYDRVDRLVYGIANQKEILDSPEDLEKMMAEEILSEENGREKIGKLGFVSKKN